MLDRLMPAIVVLIASLVVFIGLWIAGYMEQVNKGDSEDKDNGDGGCLGGEE